MWRHRAFYVSLYYLSIYTQVSNFPFPWRFPTESFHTFLFHAGDILYKFLIQCAKQPESSDVGYSTKQTGKYDKQAREEHDSTAVTSYRKTRKLNNTNTKVR